MFTMLTENTRRTVSTVAAVAVVAFTGLTLDQGHLGALPQGTVEVGELTPVNVMQMAQVTLPEIVVTGQRAQVESLANAAMPMLPEVVVVASRDQRLASAADASQSGQG
jgi:hypothetical protein